METPTLEGVSQEPTDDVGQPEVSLIHREEFEALHEEVSRLPERYRVPVVLCELEGLTYQEVARRLRCPVSTIGVRLVRARERLRVRLLRRGFVPAAVLSKAMFDLEGASALMPTVLVDSTVRAAAGFAASDAAAMGCVSAAVFALTRAVLKSMALTRLKLASSVLLGVGLTAGLGWVGNHERQAWIATLQAQALSLSSPPANSSPTTAPPSDATPTPGTLQSAAPTQPASMPEVPIVEAVKPEEEPKQELPALSTVQRAAHEEQSRGEALFFKEWVANDPASPHGDGLGPVFNETSCVACHGLGAPGGAGPENKNVVVLTVMTNNSRGVPKGLEKIHPGFRSARSTVLHRYGTDPEYASWRSSFFEADRQKAQKPAGVESVEARIQRIASQTGPDRRAREQTTRLQPASGVTLRVSERNTPALFGAGRIDAIPADVLIEEAKTQPVEVRGRVGRDPEGRIGRFGWKAQISGLHTFVRGACASEMGLEVPGHSQAASPLAPLEKAKGLDMTEPECDSLVAYVRALPMPVAVDPQGPHGTPDMAEGRQLFVEVGCATCHTPSLGGVRGIYSDLLLHEMGQVLSDSGQSYGSDGFESPGNPSPGESCSPRMAQSVVRRVPSRRMARVPASGGPRRSGASEIPALISTMAGPRPWKKPWLFTVARPPLRLETSSHSPPRSNRRSRPF